MIRCAFILLDDMRRRWKYRFIVWFYDRPDTFSRRVDVENVLLTHFKKGTSPTPEECRDLALKLGVPTWWRQSWWGR